MRALTNGLPKKSVQNLPLGELNEKIRNIEKLNQAIKDAQLIERQIKVLQNDAKYIESDRLREMEEEQKALTKVMDALNIATEDHNINEGD